MLLVGKTLEEVENEKKAKENEFTINDNLKYLKDTDWYIVRFTETNVAIPQEILDKRAAARELISSLRGEV